MQTLILTQSYLPHRVVDWRRATAMSFTGKVEVVETYDEIIRSVSLAIRMPAVVRLTRQVRFGAPKVRFARRNVLTRDGFRCQYCGQRLPARELTYDHVVPRSRGGRTTWTNIVTACRPCNARKGDRTPEQAGMYLRRPPARPKGGRFAFPQLNLGPHVPAPWKSWVGWIGAS